MKDKKNIVHLLKKQDEKVIRDIYNEYRPGFLLYANRYKLGKEQILDVYQDAIIALCENAQKGHLDNLSSSIKTYLFSIGKYMIFNILKTKKRDTNFENIENLNLEWDDYSIERKDKEIQDLQNALSQLGEKCQEILKLFYYQEESLDVITENMQYENKNVAKSQKSRCLKQLKEILTLIRNG